MARNDAGKIYSATYSNVPVYELNVENNHVMRRRSDDWINATHILKVADYDKPARTRILEREVQKGIHEKVQGGYGKYQGTWIPLPDGKELALKNGVFEKLRPIFDYVPGDRSPPPAPKHATAASNKPRAPRAPAQPRRQPVYNHVQPDYDAMDTSMRDDETPDNITVVSESGYDEYDIARYTNSRRRRRLDDHMSQADRDHQIWAEELLDYFVLQDSPLDSIPNPPIPPANANLDRPIDEKGHTALHWAAAIGDIEVVKDLIRRNASIDAQAKNGETPLMRSVIFTNNFERENMEKLAALLIRTVNMQEWFGATVFHYIVNTTQRKSKYLCARYYIDCLLNKMSEVLSTDDIEHILNCQDRNGDTAITIAARNGARKCVRSLLGRNASVSIPNNNGETADAIIMQLNIRRKERESNRQLSSSPFQGDANGGPVQPHLNGFDTIHTLNGGSSQLNGTTSTNGGEIYKSEAALTLTSQLMPLFMNKTKTLATSLDAEIAEKDAEVAEAERLVILRQAELDSLRKQAEEMRVKDLEQTSGGGGSAAHNTDDVLDKELEALERECTQLEEEEQAHALREEHARQKSKPSDNSNSEMMQIDGIDQEALVKSQFALARKLIGLRRDRVDLIKQIVTNMSVAGMRDNTHAEYKRLIVGALYVKEEDVEALLPEIVSQLEEDKKLEAAGA